MQRERPGTYKYDAAISFAGEDRKYAEAFAQELKRKGYSVFYDLDHRAELWGKQSYEYDQIYGPQSRFVIPIVSRHYKRKEWPQYEFGVAKREARRRTGEFILPIRVDDTTLLGMADETNYLSLQDLTIEDIALDFERKCSLAETLEQRSQPHKPPRREASKVNVLPLRTRHALGILATAVMPMSTTALRGIFPSINWTSELRTLSRRDLIAKVSGRVSVAPNVKKALVEDRSEERELNHLWIGALTKLQEYSDIGTCLSAHYLLEGRLNEAINTLAGASDRDHPGWWNQINLVLWRELARRSRSRLIGSQERCRLMNSIGVSLVNDAKTDEALRWFKKLRRFATRKGFKYWVAQSWLNAGVAHQNSGNHTLATRCFRQALKSSQEVQDWLTASRSAGNLAELIGEQSREEAGRLLAASIQWKKSIGDKIGLAVAYGQKGHIEAREGKHDGAISWFRRAEKLARKLGLARVAALALHDTGTALYESGKRSQAIGKYSQAYRLASAEGYEDTATLAALSQASVCFELGRYEESEAALRDALGLAENIGDRATRVACLHGLGVTNVSSGRQASGQKLLNRALQLARRTGDADWIVRCAVDKCRTLHKGNLDGFDLAKLRRAIIREEKRGEWVVAGCLWERFARESSKSNLSAVRTLSAFSSALACFAKPKKVCAEAIDAYRRFYVWLWQCGSYSEALDILSRMERDCRLLGLTDIELAARDEHGVCLQELGHPKEALKLFRSATRLARKVKNLEQLSRSLNNAGEALRSLDRPLDAIEALQESETIALRIGDHKGAIVAASNSALAFRDRQEGPKAESILRRCRDRAFRRGLWAEYVRAWMDLASVAWASDRFGLAANRYRRALAAAKKHRQGDSLPTVALNYARLCESLGDPASGLKELRKHEQRFRVRMDSYLFHFTLGSLFREVGDAERGRQQLEAGRITAERAGNSDYIALCAHGLAELHQQEAEFGLADVQLSLAISHEADPTAKALLLIELLQVRLALGNGKGAAEIYDATCALANDNDLAEVSILVDLTIGDCFWSGGSEPDFAALVSYANATVKALNSGRTPYLQVAEHVIAALTEPAKSLTPETLESLERRLARWVFENTDGQEQAARLVTWPVTAARSLLPFTNDPRRCAKERSKLISKAPWA